MADHYLSAEILMDMSKSIANVEAYSEAVDGLDTKLGSLGGKLSALADTLNKVSSTKGTNLRQSIEKQISDAINKSGVVLEDIGKDALKVDAKTIAKINKAIQSELNRELASAADNIKLQIDPSHIKTVKADIGDEHFKDFNGQIVKIVRAKMQEMRNSMSQVPVDLSKSEINNISLIIGKDLVQKTISAVKSSIVPILTNPTVNTEGVKLVIPVKNTRQVVNKVMNHVMKAVNASEVEHGTLPKGSLLEMQDHISKLVTRQITSMNEQLKSVDLNSLERPINELNRKTKNIIAQQLGTSLKELEKANMTVDSGYVRDIQFKDSFTRVEKSLNDKVGKLASNFSKSVIDQINTVSFEVQPSIAHELTAELNKINKTIVRKIKQQVDLQVAHIIAEIEAASATPLNLNSNNVNSLNNLGQQLRPRTQRINQTTNIINNYGGGGGGSNVPKSSVLATGASDPYARRDAYFNSMGMEGALQNTLRHIVAGSMVGAPLMAIYEAMNTFKETQLEMLKAYQNYYMQEYVNSGGEVNKHEIQAEIKELSAETKKMAVHYGIDYTAMSEVAAVASRVTQNEHQSKKFMDVASQILRLDNSGDIVKDIAPGLEAIMLQFGMSVYELNKVVASFAVVSNVTKASTKELMEGLARSGASFKAAGITVEQAAVLMGGAIQSTGLTAPDLGNMFKTMNTRLTMPKVEKALEEQGISVYDSYGNRRNGIELYQEIADIVTNPNTSNRVRDSLLLDTAGMYQVNKFNAFIQSMNTADVPISDEDAKYYKPFKLQDQLEAVNFESEEAMKNAMSMVHSLLADSLDNPAISMDRAGVSVNVALTSMLEELSPQIQRLADVIVNASDMVQNNSKTLAEVGAMLFNAAVGFGAMQGVKWLAGKGGYQGHLENYKMQDRIYGSKNGSVPATTAPIMGLFGAGLTDIATRNQNTFKILDMMSASPQMASIMQTLSTMDADAVKRTMQYNEDFRGGKNINSMGELASLLQESQNYFVPDMDEDTRRDRSKGTIGAMVSRDNTAQIFASTFADELRDFDVMTATPETRRMFDSMARMNDVVAADFEGFLARDTVRNGTQITSVDDLQTSYDKYRQFQAENIDTRFANDVDAYRLNNRYNDVINEVNGNNQQTGGGITGLVTNTGNAARSAGRSMLELGKTTGKLAGQFALLAAVGSVFTEWLESSMLTDKQKDVRSVSEEIQHVNNVHDYISKMQGDSSWFSKLMTTIGTTSVALSDMVLDWIPGIDRKGFDDYMVGDFSNMNYRKKLEEIFGDDNIQNIIKNSWNEETQSYELNEDKIVAKVLEETGLADKEAKAKEAEYIESYEKFMEDQQTQYDLQKKAEDARKTYNQGLLESSPNRINLTEMLDMIDEQLEGIDKENKLTELQALLGGMQTTSQEYYDMMIANVNKQIEVYNSALAYFDSHIKELEENMKILEEEGLDVGDNQKKYDMYSGDLADTKRKRQEIEEEIQLQREELELEERKLQFSKRKQAITDKQNDFADQDFYENLATEMTTEEGSVDRGESMRANIQAQLEREKSILSMYEELAKWDNDGETEELIREQKRKIAEFNRSFFETYQQDLSSYTDNISKVEAKNSIEMLRAQVASGITDANDPALRGIRMSLLGKELTAVNSELAKAQATLAELVASGADPTTISDYEDTIINLERQSLEVQLEQLSEMKSSKGTFNLPDGLKVMTELDYRMGQSTHSQYTFQQGETYVTVVLPNVTGMTNQNTVNSIGRSLGTGISSGRLSSYRTQISSNPNSYRVLT